MAAILVARAIPSIPRYLDNTDLNDVDHYCYGCVDHWCFGVL